MTTGVVPNTEKIDQLRTLRGLTWTELSRAAGLSQGVRTKLRKGEPVAIRSLRQIAGVLHVEFAEVVEQPDDVEDVSECEGAAGLLVSGSAA